MMKNEKTKQAVIDAVGIKNGSARCFRRCEIVDFSDLDGVVIDHVKSDAHFEGISPDEQIVVWDLQGGNYARKNAKYKQGAPLSSFQALSTLGDEIFSLGVMSTSAWTADVVVFEDGDLIAVVSIATKG